LDKGEGSGEDRERGQLVLQVWQFTALVIENEDYELNIKAHNTTAKNNENKNLQKKKIKTTGNENGNGNCGNLCVFCVKHETILRCLRIRFEVVPIAQLKITFAIATTGY